MKRTIIALMMCLAGITATAEIVDFAVYHLDDEGFAQDSSGNGRHYDVGNPGTATTNNPSPVSSTSKSYDGTSNYSYGCDWSGLASTNFVIETWAYFGNNASSMDMLTTSGGNGGLKFTVNAGAIFKPSLHNVAYISDAEVQLETNTWLHLAVVHQEGSYQIFTNGVAATTSYAAAGLTTPDNGPILGAGIGAHHKYTGQLDELRVFTFDNGDDYVSAFNTIPEPKLLGLLPLIGAGFLFIRRLRKYKAI